MSASVSTATPHFPTSPSASSSSESRPISVGRSNAVDSPSLPDASSSWKRRFVSSAVPKPANIRIVQSFERYIDAYGPRVYGYWPGNSPSSGPYTGVDRNARHRREVGVARRRRPRTLLATRRGASRPRGYKPIRLVTPWSRPAV